MLREILHTDSDVLLPVGSATYGEEAAFNTLLEHDEVCITVNTGMFGQVLTDLVRVVGATAQEIMLPRGTAITVEQARRSLREHPNAKMFAVVHIETTSGTLNPVREIGEMVRKEFPHVLYLVDAVSSLTSEHLYVDEWGIDVCCTSSQKCVNAPQGIAIVVMGPRAWQAVDQRTSPIPGLCLDLVTWRSWHQKQQEARKLIAAETAVQPSSIGDSTETKEAVDTSVTEYKAAHGPSQSYSLLLALQGALSEIIREGPDEVIARHAAAGQALRAGVRAMGLQVLADDTCAASCSTCVVMPGDSFPTQDYMKTLWREHGIATAGGSQTVDEMGYAGSRVGLMGFVANLESVCAILDAMEQVLPRYGVAITPGRAIAAARATG
jgi:aspartate aminotransferase-like enzyme